jgi:ATP-dependent helicase/nuclease subunit B
LPLVEEALQRASIPAYYTRGTRRPHASGRAFLALLACAAESYSASRFAEYLSLGEVPKLDAKGAPPPVVEVPWIETQGDQLVFKSFVPIEDKEDEEDLEALADDAPAIEGTLRVPRDWEDLLVDAAVLGGRDRWERRLNGLDAEIALQIRELDHSGEQMLKREHLERRRRELKRLKRFALPVIGDLAELPEEAPWGIWLDALGKLAGRVLRQSERVLAVLAELRPMEEVGPVGLDEVRRVLERRLKFLRTELSPRRYGQVFVATIEEARGREFETVFLPGLAEGLFPRRATEDPLLLDDSRQKLDADLLVQTKRIARERLLLKIAAGAARERLIVSYPNLDAVQGRSRVPSFYALDVLRAAEGRLPRLRELESRASRETAALLGWPAPGSPERAIDDAEFDLSTLEPLMRQEPEKTTSRARYLLEWNEPLKRSLRSRYLRWKAGSKLTWADGLVGPEAGSRAALDKNRLHNRAYSPTALQSYAQCPYRFLLYAIHRLRPREEAAALEQMDPLTRGSLFHEVQFKLFHQLKEKDLLPMREDNVENLFHLADAQLDETAERYRDQLAPAIPRVWESEIESLKTDLRGWVQSVVVAKERWRPEYFELSFGLPLSGEHDPASQPEEVEILGGVRLRGAIDLVEVDEEHGVVRVTDHKTGRSIRTPRILVKGGEVLQPLLYALVAEKLLERPVKEGRLFYCTRRGDYLELKVGLNDDSRRCITEVVRSIDKAVEDGFLPAAPRQGACRFCDYKLVCGPNEEMRLERKRKEQLTALTRLRKMP